MKVKCPICLGTGFGFSHVGEKPYKCTTCKGAGEIETKSCMDNW